MEIYDEPAGYFITWTVYGTFLQGDSRWWRKRAGGERPPQPLLEQWHRDRLKHDVILLNDCLLYTSPSPRDQRGSRMPSSA